MIKNVCPWMFTAVLVTVVKTWKQPRWPSTVNGKKKTKNCGAFIKWNRKKKIDELWNHEKHGGNLSKESQSEKTIYYVIPTAWHSWERKIMATVKRSMVVRVWCKGRERQISRGQEIFRAVKVLSMKL